MQGPHCERRYTREDIQRAYAAKQKKYAAIRRDADAGMSERAIEADPAIGTAAIWQRLADDHGVTVAYPTLRTYVTSRRATMQPPAAGVRGLGSTAW